MKAPRRNRRHTGGLTLIELIVVVALMALFMGTIMFGMGAATNSRVRAAATLVASGVRVAFTRAASTSKSMRVVFDLEQNTMVLEESDMPMLVRRDDVTGSDGATGATPQEEAAIHESERLIKGPTAPRPLFKPVNAFGFDAEDPTKGRELGRGVAFRRVEVAHAEDPYLSGRAYLYFWPGGQTERASIQVGRKGDTGDDAVLSVLVSPLTGRVRIEGGAKPMERPRDDSEREDRGF
jgi:general secretion pathway protein H